MNDKNEVIVEIDGERMKVPRQTYVQAKLKQLRNFGYAHLTEKEVDEQVTAVLEKKTLMKGLTVIGGFMQGELIVPSTK